MKLRQLTLALAALAGLSGLAYVSQDTETAGGRMADAARRLLDGLTPQQKAKAVFPFADRERFNWNFVPLQEKRQPLRKGLPLGEMTDAQKETARLLLQAGTSAAGFSKASTIISLEDILRDLEKGGTNVRDPGWYFVSLFGTPSRTGQWGWRLEGHHLSLNFMLDRGQIASATPAFFGANPAEVKAGDRKGLRTLPEAEDPARKLFASLDEGQRKVALQSHQFPEIEQGKPVQHLGTPVGLSAARMNDKQRGLLLRLIEGYADRMTPEVARAEMAQVKEAGLDKVTFAFAVEESKPGKPYTYRVYGPTFVIEFLNVQADSARNPANHIHSVWRNTRGDFGTATP